MEKEFLKKKLRQARSLNELRTLVELSDKLSIRSQCSLLGIYRSGLYYAPTKESEKNLSIMRMLDERYLDKPTYGVLQMQDYLRDEGYQPFPAGINHQRVRQLLRLMGLMAIYPKKNLSKLGHVEYIYPYLLRNLKIGRSNQAWEIDITARAAPLYSNGKGFYIFNSHYRCV